VEQKDLEWQNARGLAERALRVVEDLMRQNEKVRLESPLGGEPPDVDFWSRGALSRLRGELTEQLGRVHDTGTPLSLDELRTIATRTAVEFEERLDTIVQQAGTAIYASQLRTNFAEIIAVALDTNHHYTVDDSTFAGDDQRDAFYAKGRHLDGSEVVIEVEPTADDRTDCVVRVLSYDRGTPSEEERSARAESITETLRQHGIRADAREDGTPDPALRDLDRIRHTTTRPARPAASADRRQDRA
jgi:hypothetical protein